MNTRAQLRYLPGGIVRASAQCADAGLGLFGVPGLVPPPHGCYLPPGHKDKWHRCRCGCSWTLEGGYCGQQPTLLLDELGVSGMEVVLPRTRLAALGRVEVELEPDVPSPPAMRADHPWLVWVGRGLAVAALVIIVFGATGPW